MSDVRTGRCAWCGAYFEWTPNSYATPKLYCKPKHAERARVKSKKIRDAMPADVCPTPHKRSYPNVVEASEALRRQQPMVQGTRPYLCNCGKYHLGRVERGPRGRPMGDNMGDRSPR